MVYVEYEKIRMYFLNDVVSVLHMKVLVGSLLSIFRSVGSIVQLSERHADALHHFLGPSAVHLHRLEAPLPPADPASSVQPAKSGLKNFHRFPFQNVCQNFRDLSHSNL